MDKRVIEQGLQRKGFDVGQRDHCYFIYCKDGKRTGIKTKTSHGSKKDIGQPLLAQMARQCGLTKQEFVDLIDCTLAQVEYERILQSKGLL